jgi:hypothetical protein
VLLSANQIDKSIAWLLDNGSAPVRYLTHKYLLKTPSGSEMDNLWSDVRTCKDAEEILSKQREDGSWCSGGSWALKPSYLQKSKPGGYDPESPKYVTTMWVLPLLRDMGFTVEDERIRNACEYMLSYRAEGMEVCYHIFNDPSFSPDYAGFAPCRFAQWLVALGKVGLQDDGRVKKGYEILLGSQREDGGWVYPGHFRERNWTRSCPASSYGATLALYYSKDEGYRNQLVKALEFLVWHLSTKQVHEIQRFFYHGHSTVHELLMFSELQVGLETKPVQALLEWLMTMYRPDEGCFKYTGKPISKYSRHKDAMDSRVAKYRLYHLIEDDWLTYYATRIGANLIRRA